MGRRARWCTTCRWAAGRPRSGRAAGVATGELNAQEAFIKGRILLTGSQQKLVDSQPVFAALDAVFTSVRERTEYR